MIVQPAMLYGMETVPTNSSHVKKLEVTELKMCRWEFGHTLRDHVRNDDIRERFKLKTREHHREEQESKSGVVWTRQEARPTIRRKKDSGDGITWEKKMRKIEAEVDGLYQAGHESHRNDKR